MGSSNNKEQEIEGVIALGKVKMGEIGMNWGKRFNIEIFLGIQMN